MQDKGQILRAHIVCDFAGALICKASLRLLPAEHSRGCLHTGARNHSTVQNASTNRIEVLSQMLAREAGRPSLTSRSPLSDLCILSLGTSL